MWKNLRIISDRDKNVDLKGFGQNCKAKIMYERVRLV